jgi:hypothetical protein
VGNSKTKFRNGLYSFDTFSRYGDSATQLDLEKVMTKGGLTFDHRKVMAYLKDCGDFGAHASRPNLTKDEWFEVIWVMKKQKLRLLMTRKRRMS